MDARLLLQRKQEAVAALKAGQYKKALETLQQAQDTSPGGKLQDLLLAELFSTVQQKVAQDEAVSSDDGADASLDSDTGSDGTSTQGDSGSSSDNSSEVESDDEQDDTVEVLEHAHAATVQQRQQHSQTSTAPPALQQAAACPGVGNPAGGSCQFGLQEGVHVDDDPDAAASPCYQAGQQAALTEQGSVPAPHSIQLAASSCSLSHSERAHLRQQLAANIEEQKTAAALEKALASDPLLSMSLS